MTRLNCWVIPVFSSDPDFLATGRCWWWVYTWSVGLVGLVTGFLLLTTPLICFGCMTVVVGGDGFGLGTDLFAAACTAIVCAMFDMAADVASGLFVARMEIGKPAAVTACRGDDDCFIRMLRQLSLRAYTWVERFLS